MSCGGSAEDAAAAGSVKARRHPHARYNTLQQMDAHPHKLLLTDHSDSAQATLSQKQHPSQHSNNVLETNPDKLEAKMPTPPPTREYFVFTAPTTQSPRGSNLFPGLAASGTTQVDKSKQIPYVNLREKVALQNIALEKLQAKVDAQEQAQKDEMERLMQHQKTVLQGLAGQVHSIQHGMCAHFEGVVEALSAKVYKMEKSWGLGSLKSVTCKQPMYCKSSCMCRQRPHEAEKVNTTMQEGPCTAVTRSECTHGPACQGGSFAHLT